MLQLACFVLIHQSVKTLNGYGPGEGYYPDGGYGYAGDLADADAWEHASELSCS